MRPFGVTLLISAFALTLAACTGSSGDIAPEKGDRAVAKVEGQTIWTSDVKREAVAQGLIGESESLDATSDLFRRVLDEVVDRKLLAREAERRGLDDSAEAQRRLRATRERMLSDMLVEGEVDKTISDRAVQTLYNEQLRLARETEEIRTRLILLRSRKEAEATLGLLAQGSTFEAVAAQRSIDEATRLSGGDLGYSTPDVMPDAYAAAIGQQPVGSVVGPIETTAGWALLKVEDRRKETPPTLEQARPQIVRYLTYEGVRQLLEDLRGKARINITLPTRAPARPAPTAPIAAPPATSPAPSSGQTKSAA